MDYLKKILFFENKTASKDKGPTGGQWENLLAYASSIDKIKKPIDISKLKIKLSEKKKEKKINPSIEPEISKIENDIESVKERNSHIIVWEKFKNKKEETTKKTYTKIAELIIETIDKKDFKKVKNGEPSITWKRYFFNIAKMIEKHDAGTIGTPNGTSKTDLITGAEKYSLKKTGGSQLMSGFRAETLATLFAAFDMTTKTDSDKFIKEFKKEIQNIILGMGGSPDDYTDGKNGFESATDITKLLQKIHDEYLNSIGIFPKPNGKAWRPKGIKYNSTEVKNQIKKQDGWKDLETKIKKYVQNSWERRDLHKVAQNSFNFIFKNDNIWKNFLLEAASGIKKFGENTQQCADYILEFDPSNPSNTNSKKIKQWVDSHFGEIKLTISFKTAGDRINDSCRLIVGNIKDDEEDVEADTSSFNNLNSALSDIFYTEAIGKKYNKKTNIYVDTLEFDKVMNNIYNAYFGIREDYVSMESATMAIGNVLGTTSGNIQNITNTLKNKLKDTLKDLTEPDSYSIAAEEKIAMAFKKEFPSIMQNFINIATPSFAKQYERRISRILKHPKISQKFFRLLLLLNIKKIEIINNIGLFQKIESENFSFMFKERGNE
jgi:hypothetical protein